MIFLRLNYLYNYNLLMVQVTCVAIDDEPLALGLLKTYVSRMPSLLLLQVFEDAVAASEYIRHHGVDLLFLDINMPDINGLQLAKSLAGGPLIIFTTAHKKFAFEGFELEAVDYLLKPIEFERFSKAVNKAIDFIQYKNSEKSAGNESIFVKSEYKLVRIPLNQIEYIESVDDYLKIHLTSTKPVMTLMTMKALLEKLPPAAFRRIHRSYVIPFAKIKSIANRKVQLTSVELPVSDSYANFIK